MSRLRTRLFDLNYEMGSAQSARRLVGQVAVNARRLGGTVEVLEEWAQDRVYHIKFRYTVKGNKPYDGRRFVANACRRLHLTPGAPYSPYPARSVA